MSSTSVQWPDRIHAVFQREQIRQVAYVPDAGHSRLINLCIADRGIRDVVLTTEEEGVAMTAGAWLGGQRSALLMQSSGVGNCINMLAMTKACAFPLVMLVTMRGEYEEFNPWQVPMGTTTEAALKLSGVEVARIEEAEAVEKTVERIIDYAFSAERACALLLSQRLIGAKQWVK